MCIRSRAWGNTQAKTLASTEEDNQRSAVSGKPQPPQSPLSAGQEGIRKPRLRTFNYCLF